MFKLETKAIFNSFLAKQLVNRGNQIVDLQRNHHIQNATVFYFKVTEKFLLDLRDLTTV